MFGIGMPELLVILGLALILIGPKKLPQLAKSLGKTMGELRKATDDLKETISEEINPIKDEIPRKKINQRPTRIPQTEQHVEEKQTFIEHLEELRKRLIISLIAVGIGFVISYIFAKEIFQILMIPLQKALPQGATMIYTRLPEAFFTYLKVALLAGIFAASPVVLYQIWLFVAPALYSREKRYAIPFVISSTLLFIGDFNALCL